MKPFILFILIWLVSLPIIVLSQGRNNIWLVGNDPGWPLLGRFTFESSNYQYQTEPRKMSFKGTEATISDEQGNFLMSSNGIWIANANNDTMMNGSGLNPGPFANSFSNGLVIDYGNLFIPYPADTSKYILFHQTGTTNLQNFPSFEIYSSLIDKSLDGGLGGVISKNDTIIQDTLSWGLTACKHGNGRDWWVIAQKDSSSILYLLLLTPNGISSITTQNLGYTPFSINASQITFSQSGSKFIQTNYDNPASKNCYLIVSDFDRCQGIFSNTQTIQLTSGNYLWGLTFSPSGNYIYACSSGYIFQINSTTLSVDTVAIYDGFISGFPPNCCETSFYDMYLAANGKIYTTSGSSVQHIHEMNYPDSAGTACDVQQHAINLGVWNLRSVPNHPNYYLGAADGTICDSLGLNNVIGLSELKANFRVAPNPNNGNFSIMYLLPQGKSGFFYIYDVEGREIFSQVLPSWSTMQQISLPDYISAGVYNCVISSEHERINKKIIIVQE